MDILLVPLGDSILWCTLTWITPAPACCLIPCTSPPSKHGFPFYHAFWFLSHTTPLPFWVLTACTRLAPPALMNTQITCSESDFPYWAAVTSGACLSHSPWTLVPHARSPLCWNATFTSLRCLYLLLLFSLCELTFCMGPGLTLFEFWYLMSNNSPLPGYSHLPLHSGLLTACFLIPTASPAQFLLVWTATLSYPI